jgi:hypothetical protein
MQLGQIKLTKVPSPPESFKQLSQLPPSSDATPGFLVSVDEVTKHRPDILQQIVKASGIDGKVAPFLVVRPQQVPELFDKATVANFKKLAGLVTKDAPPLVKAANGILWLIIGGKDLLKSWKQPNRDTTAWLFEAAGEFMELTDVTGILVPGLKIPENVAGRLNFIVSTGGKIFKGTTPPVGEILPKDKQREVALRLQNIGSAALDENFKRITAATFAAIKEEGAAKERSKIKRTNVLKDWGQG